MSMNHSETRVAASNSISDYGGLNYAPLHKPFTSNNVTINHNCMNRESRSEVDEISNKMFCNRVQVSRRNYEFSKFKNNKTSNQRYLEEN